MEGNHRGKVESKEIFYAELEEFAREKDAVRKPGRLHINVAELLGFLALLFPLLRIRNPSGTPNNPSREILSSAQKHQQHRSGEIRS